MSQTGAEPSPGGTGDEEIERRYITGSRRGGRFPNPTAEMVRPAARVDLDPAVVDAITLTVDRSIEALLPGLVEDAVARVLPDAIESVVTDVVEALQPLPAKPATRKRRAAKDV